MNRITALAAIALTALMMLPAVASAKVRIQLANCSSKKVTYCIWNGKDGATAIVHNRKVVDAGKTKMAGCKGQGKGRCKVITIKGDKQCGLDGIAFTPLKVKKGEAAYTTDGMSDITTSAAAKVDSCN